MGGYSNVGYKAVRKIKLPDADAKSVIQDIRDSIQVMTTDDLNNMRNPMYQFMI